MKPRPGLQTIAIHILLNISQSKEDITRNIFSFKNYAENEPRRLVTDLFLFC